MRMHGWKRPHKSICIPLLFLLSVPSSSAWRATTLSLPVVPKTHDGSSTTALLASRITLAASSPSDDSNFSGTKTIGAASTKFRNSRARELLQFIRSRYESPSMTSDSADKKITVNHTNQWKKLQMYLYRAQDRLTWGQMEQVLDFLDTRVPRTTSQMIVQTVPRILRKPVDSFLQPTADFLLSLWGPELFLEAINRNPQLLLSSGVGYTQRNNNADQEIIDILIKIAGLSPKAIDRLKQSSPFVFGLPTAKVQGILEFLLGLLQATDDDHAHSSTTTARHQDTLSRIIMTHPHLLNLSVDANLQPRVEFLQSTCHLNATHIAKIVHGSNGAILSLSIKDNLKPTLDYLNQILSVSDDESKSVDALRKCLLSHPQVLMLSMTNLQRKVQYFSDLDGTTDDAIGNNDSNKAKDKTETLASRILRRCPAVYSLSLTENIIPKVNLLAKAWGLSISTSTSKGASQDTLSLSHALQEFPNILTMSLEGNILPTLNFFNRTRYTVLTDNWELVEGATRIPGRYMAASLYNRLLPRWHYCLSQGLSVVTGGGTMVPSEEEESLPPPPPLHLLVQADDATFCQRLNLDYHDFVEYKKTSIPRLKFSSQFDTWLKTGRPIQV